MLVTIGKCQSNLTNAGNTDEQVRAKSLQANQELFTHLSQSDENGNQRWAAPRDLPLARKLSGHVAAIAKQLEKRYDPTLGGENGDGAHYEMTIERVEQLAEEIMALGQPALDDIVRYCERGSDGREKVRLVLYQEPVDVADFLRRSLWDETATVICTSATLTTGRASAADGAFDHFCRQTGAPRGGALKRVIASPFDYAEQALLYTPQGLHPRCDEGEEEYVQKLADRVKRWR